MRKWLQSSIVIAAGALWFAAPAHAVPVLTSIDGISYKLEMGATTNGGLTQQFAIIITGENSITDIIGGRTGINAIALNDFGGTSVSGNMEATLINGVITTAPTGYNFAPGGLNSGGCDGSGNFFCFDNTNIPPTPAGPLITGPVIFVFDVTLQAGGSWANYATSQPHFKIDWVGSANNYDLFSQEILVQTTCPDCTPTQQCTVGVNCDAIPEPASMAILGAGLLGLGAIVRRRRS